MSTVVLPFSKQNLKFFYFVFIIWQEETRPDLFATTGDYLRLWKVSTSDDGRSTANLDVILNNVFLFYFYFQWNWLRKIAKFCYF